MSSGGVVWQLHIVEIIGIIIGNLLRLLSLVRSKDLLA